MKIDDRLFERVWNHADDLTEVVVALGYSRSRASNRAALMRGRGVELKRFQAGRQTGRLPNVLQVAAWEWVRVPGGSIEHRRAIGEDVTLCLRQVPAGAGVVARGLRPCSRCWPVDAFPPTRGPLPDVGRGVVVLVAHDRAILAARSEPGADFRDVETDDVVPLDLDNFGWWTP